MQHAIKYIFFHNFSEQLEHQEPNREDQPCFFPAKQCQSCYKLLMPIMKKGHRQQIIEKYQAKKNENPYGITAGV